MLIISKQQDRRDGLAFKRSCQSYRQVGSIGSTYMGFTTTHYYKFRGCKAIFWLLWVQGTHVVHIHVYRQKTHIDSKEFKANTLNFSCISLTTSIPYMQLSITDISYLWSQNATQSSCSKFHEMNSHRLLTGALTLLNTDDSKNSELKPQTRNPWPEILILSLFQKNHKFGFLTESQMYLAKLGQKLQQIL